MKILMLCDLYVEEAEYQENLMTKYYNKLGHKVVIVASVFESVVDFNLMKMPKSYTESVKDLTNDTRLYRRKYFINFVNRIRKLSNVYDILKLEKPDLIFSHGIHLNLLDAKKYIKKNANCKLLMDYHGDYSNSAKNYFSVLILHKIIRKFMVFDKVKNDILKIFPINPSSAEFLHKIYNVSYKDMEVLPLGGDVDLLDKIRDTRDEVRLSLGIHKDDFVIFTGGKMSFRRKTDLLVNAFKMLNLPKLHLLMVGDISTDVTEITKNEVKSNVNIHFLGWQDGESVYKYMNASDIGVFPIGQSVMWCKAICAGLPLIVGLRSGSEFDYLNKYRNVIIMNEPEITVDNLIKNISLIYNNPDLCYDMRVGALKVSSDCLDWNSLITRTFI